MPSHLVTVGADVGVIVAMILDKNRRFFQVITHDIIMTQHWPNTWFGPHFHGWRLAYVYDSFQ